MVQNSVLKRRSRRNLQDQEHDKTLGEYKFDSLTTRDWYWRGGRPDLDERILNLPDFEDNIRQPAESLDHVFNPHIDPTQDLIRHADPEEMYEEPEDSHKTPSSNNEDNFSAIHHDNTNNNVIGLKQRELPRPEDLESSYSNKKGNSARQQEAMDILEAEFDAQYAISAPPIIEDPETLLNLKEGDSEEDAKEDEWEDGM